MLCILFKNFSSLLDFIYANQYTLYTQMYQPFKYTVKSLKTRYDLSDFNVYLKD